MGWSLLQDVRRGCREDKGCRVHFGSKIENTSLASKSTGTMCCAMAKSRMMDASMLSSDYSHPGKIESFGKRSAERSARRSLSLTHGLDTGRQGHVAHPEYHFDRYML